MMRTSAVVLPAQGPPVNTIRLIFSIASGFMSAKITNNFLITILLGQKNMPPASRFLGTNLTFVPGKPHVPSVETTLFLTSRYHLPRHKRPSSLAQKAIAAGEDSLSRQAGQPVALNKTAYRGRQDGVFLKRKRKKQKKKPRNRENESLIFTVYASIADVVDSFIRS